MSKVSKENAIGRKIRQRRLQLGLSQEELAESLGISYQQVQKYENGISQLTIRRLQQITRRLSVEMDYFLKDLPVTKEIRVSYGGLSADEKRLLKQYRSISSPSARRMLLRLFQSIARLIQKRSHA
jgi:transcriptional regulator with XRE-family HTH domain